MDADLPEEVLAAIRDMKDSVAEVEAHLNPLLALAPATGTALTNPLSKPKPRAGPASAAANGTLKELVIVEPCPHPSSSFASLSLSRSSTLLICAIAL